MLCCLILHNTFAVSEGGSNAEHDSFTKAHMVALVTMCQDVILEVHMAAFFVVRYNLDIGTIYCNVEVKMVAKLVPMLCADRFLRGNLYCRSTHKWYETLLKRPEALKAGHVNVVGESLYFRKSGGTHNDALRSLTFCGRVEVLSTHRWWLNAMTNIERIQQRKRW